MITRQQINQLLGFRDGKYLVTSCYLNLDRSKMPAQILKILAKDLLQAVRDRRVVFDQRTDPISARSHLSEGQIARSSAVKTICFS